MSTICGGLFDFHPMAKSYVDNSSESVPYKLFVIEDLQFNYWSILK